MSAPYSPLKEIPHRIIQDNMTCGFCHRMLWDCRCPSDVECKHCSQSLEDADFLGRICDDSPNGEHDFVDVSPEG